MGREERGLPADCAYTRAERPGGNTQRTTAHPGRHRVLFVWRGDDSKELKKAPHNTSHGGWGGLRHKCCNAVTDKL